MSLLVGENTGRVEIRRSGNRYRLYRNGEPFYVKGVAGFEDLSRLVERGGNALRTWGSDQTLSILDQAQQFDLALCAGLWMQSPRKGFDYGHAEAVSEQHRRLVEEVAAIVGHPSLLFWGAGNELDLANQDLRVWDAVERLARAIKQLDPWHPVITVIASPARETVQAIQRRCPTIDALGVNAYADLDKVAPALAAAGWRKPYLVTEWGSNGSWEVPKTPWGAPIEPNSFQKAEQMRARYRMIAAQRAQCLGSFAFFWGNKQETTPTWFNLLDSDGGEYEGVAALDDLWSGRRTSSYAGPRVNAIWLSGRSDYTMLRPGDSAEARLEFATPGRPSVSVDWRLLLESAQATMGGDPEQNLEAWPTRFAEPAAGRARFVAPDIAGAYRLYAYVTDKQGRRASANLPFLVK